MTDINDKIAYTLSCVRNKEILKIRSETLKNYYVFIYQIPYFF